MVGFVVVDGPLVTTRSREESCRSGVRDKDHRWKAPQKFLNCQRRLLLLIGAVVSLHVMSVATLGRSFTFGRVSESKGRKSLQPLQASFSVTPASAKEFELAVESGDPVVVDFYATWCGPCQMMVPELNEVAGRLGHRVTLLKVDTDLEPELSTQLGIEALPTLLFFKGGEMKPVYAVEGVVLRDQLQAIIEEKLLDGVRDE
eukprot:TRINITY_DN55277_c0_g1_i1.p1 TRINITY_DN55277_c0_g1~~TRINITY_DN55277_c0_g1_i1.p1  ORF type:complete len:236 (+),score=29.58 TRINITY_DN55277_c0_g1_i1:103-708(+)